MCPRYDPKASDSPHIGGVQPTWGDLAYACELIKPYHQMPDRPAADIKSELADRGKETKVDQQHRFLELLGILDAEEGLLPSGIWLAEHFETPNQTTLSSGIQLDVKLSLSPEEQGIWKTVLFEQNWLPMIAIINQLATTRTEATETESRAEAFRDRVEHLDSYQPVNSINSWRKKGSGTSRLG